MNMLIYGTVHSSTLTDQRLVKPSNAVTLYALGDDDDSIRVYQNNVLIDDIVTHVICVKYSIASE